MDRVTFDRSMAREGWGASPRPGFTPSAPQAEPVADVELSTVQQHRSALLEWIGPRLTRDRYLAQTLTFKPYRGGRVTREAAVATLAEFLRRVQRKALGREYSRRGGYLQVVPVLEGGDGALDTHPHLHLLTEIPAHFPTADFADLSAACWTSLALAGPHEHRHDLCADPKGWLEYLLKVRDKPSYADALVTEQLRL